MATRADDRVLVLAAGRGTRMGTPKALMPVGGEPWWVRQMRRIGEAGLEQTWVVSRAVRAGMGDGGGGADLVLADASAPMYESLETGLIHLSASPPRGVFVLPVDVPTPVGGVFGALSGGGGGMVSPVVPVYRGATGHPVYLTWGWVCDRILTAAHGGRAAPIVDEARRLDRLIGAGGVRIEVDDPAVAVNLNTPADVQDWCARG